MPFATPTLDDLRASTRAQFAARLPGADMTLRRGVLVTIAEVLARGMFLLYRALGGWFARQLFIETMAAEYLDRAAARYGLTRTGATRAAGTATFSGTIGLPVPSGTPLQTSDGSAQYTTQADGTIGGGGTVSIAVEATTASAGAAGNALAGALLTITTAIPGVLPTATVDSGGLTGGIDAEADEALRSRVLARIRQPPQGGAATDYVAWAKAVAGVTRVWVFPLRRGPGTVDVAFVMDGRVNNIPLSGDITAVQAAIDAVRPVTADCLVFAPTADALAITVTALTPTSAAIQAAVTAQLDALVRTIAPGGATVGDGVTAGNPGGYLFLSQIEAAVQAAAGVLHFDLTVPASDLTYATGHLPAPPTITFA